MQIGGFVTPFVVLGAFMVLTVPVSLCVLPPDDHHDPSQEPGSIKQLLRIPAVSVTGVAIFVASLTWVVLDPTLEPHLRPFNLSPSIIGLIFLLMSACYACCSPIWGWIADNVVSTSPLSPTSFPSPWDGPHRLPPPLQRDSAPMMIVGFLLLTFGFSLLGPSPLILYLIGEDFR